MVAQPGQPKRRIRVIRSKNVLTKEYIEECRALQERILKRRGGKLMPSSVEIIRAHRDGICVECGRDIVEANQMAESNMSRKVRVSRPRRVPKRSWIEEARQVRKDILKVRGGVPVPSTAEVIREIRESEQA
jgi:hypothetical protein